jgi:small subunit ribosomal protein S15
MAKTKKSKQLERPPWLKYSEEEVKQIIQKLGNKGITSEKIGLILRDQYGIPKVKIYNLKIKKVLDEKGIFEEPTLKNLGKKVEKVTKHIERHKHDQVGHRSLTISKAKFKKIQSYQSKR